MQNVPVWPSLYGEVIKKPHTQSRVCFSNKLEFQGDLCLELTHNTEGCFSTALHLHRVLKQTEAVPAGEILVLHLHRAQNPRCCKPHVSCCGNLLWKVQEIWKPWPSSCITNRRAKEDRKALNSRLPISWSCPRACVPFLVLHRGYFSCSKRLWNHLWSLYRILKSRVCIMHRCQ